MNYNLKIRKELLIFLLGIFFASCSSNVEETTILEEEEEEIETCAPTSFASDIKPIIDANCIQCHNGSQSPDLRTFNGISGNAARVKGQVASRQMPLGGSLSTAEIEAIVCWVDSGAPNN